MKTEQPIATPCRAACKNDGGICSGCQRTVAEVATWSSVSDAQRQDKMDQLSGVQSTHHCTQCGQPAYCDVAAGQNTCWCFEIEKRDTSSLKQNQHCLCRQCLSKLPLL